MKRGIFSTMLALLLIAAVFVIPIVNSNLTQRDDSKGEVVDRAKDIIVDRDDNGKKPIIIPKESDDDVTFIVELKNDSLIDTVISSNGKYKSVKELILSEDGKYYCDTIRRNQAIVKASVQKLISGADFDGGKTFSAVMNGFTVKAPLSAKSRIESINGVSRVLVSDNRDNFYIGEDDDITYEPVNEEITDEQSDNEISDVQTETEVTDNTGTESYGNTATPEKLSSAFKEVIGADKAYSMGMTGDGVLIAVIDSEFNVNHEALSADPKSIVMKAENLEALTDISSFNIDKSTSYLQLYVNKKIAFAYDYAKNRTNTTDISLSHGTAVAAAAAGNNGKTGSDEYKGVAYDSQLVLMKVAEGRDAGGRIYTKPSYVIAAIDDAVKLGSDVINIGFGEYRGSENSSIYDSVLKKVAKTGVCIVCAAGNGSFNGHEYGDTLHPDDIDYSAGNYISYTDGVITAASVGNKAYEIKYFNINDNHVFYRDISKNKFSDYLNSLENPPEYIFLDAEGSRDDFRSAGTANKLVVVQKSSLAADKIYNNAAMYEAAALAVIDDGKNEEYSLEKDEGSIPFIILDSSNAEFFKQEPSGTISKEVFGIISEVKGETGVSQMTSYGVSDKFTLSPRVLACGESVYSASSDGRNDFYSGTSMSSACTSGACAIILQGMREGSLKHSPSMNDNKYISSILLETADPIGYGKNVSGGKLYISPRLQGGGIIDLGNALTSDFYITDTDGGAPSGSMGDGVSGEYEFPFVIHNTSDVSKKYQLSYVMQNDRVKTDDDGKILNTLKPGSFGSNTKVQFILDGNAVGNVNVDAGESRQIKLKIKLDKNEADSIMNVFENGFYIDGFVFVRDKESSKSLSIPFMCFYGKSENIDPFDNMKYDFKTSISGLENVLCAVAENGVNYRSCDLIKHNDVIMFSREAVRNNTENDSYGSSFILPDINFLRDVYDLTVSVSDKSGKELFAYNFGMLSAYRSKDIRPYEKLTAHSFELEKFFSKITDGTYKYTVTAKTMKPDGKLSSPFKREFTVVVESQPPASVSAKTYTENNRVYLELSAKDNSGIQDFILYATAYNSSVRNYSYVDRLTELIAANYLSGNAYEFTGKRELSDGTAVFRYDITELNAKLVRLKYRTDTWANGSSSLKIAYKAVDNAYNHSEAKTADTIAYGTAEFVFKDKEGRPAYGITVEMDGKKKVTDREGKALFSGLKPDFYIVNISFDDKDYEFENKRFIIGLNNSAIDYKQEFEVERLSEYKEPSIEEPEESSDVSEKKLAVVSDESGSDDVSNSPYALLFVGVLLIICGVSFVVRKTNILLGDKSDDGFFP